MSDLLSVRSVPEIPPPPPNRGELMIDVISLFGISSAVHSFLISLFFVCYLNAENTCRQGHT